MTRFSLSCWSCLETSAAALFSSFFIFWADSMPLIISAADLKKQNKINVPNFQGAWYCASSLICRQFRWGTNLWAPTREEWCITLRTMRSCLDGEEKHSALPELNLATARRGVNTCCVYLCNYWKQLMFSLYHSFGPQFSFWQASK